MKRSQKNKVVLGVAESDAHVVANHLIAYLLRENGFEVINLGACTPVPDFLLALEENPDAVALIIGTLNGHAVRDLKGLRTAKDEGRINCPVIVGGNLSVGSQKSAETVERIRDLGADHILESHEQILPLLLELQTKQELQTLAV